MNFNSFEEKASDSVLLTFWKRLQLVKTLSFDAKTHTEEVGGWNGRGKGDVWITRESKTILVFTEKGNWKNGEESQKIDFSNVFRWTFDRIAGVISLEHLRRGPHHPVFLFHLAPVNQYTLSSLDSHLCGKDAYFGQILLYETYLRLNWRVIGPKKNEEMDYYYL